jgi:hypothetical protein
MQPICISSKLEQWEESCSHYESLLSVQSLLLQDSRLHLSPLHSAATAANMQQDNTDQSDVSSITTTNSNNSKSTGLDFEKALTMYNHSKNDKHDQHIALPTTNIEKPPSFLLAELPPLRRVSIRRPSIDDQGLRYANSTNMPFIPTGTAANITRLSRLVRKASFTDEDIGLYGNSGTAPGGESIRRALLEARKILQAENQETANPCTNATSASASNAKVVENSVINNNNNDSSEHNHLTRSHTCPSAISSSATNTTSNITTANNNHPGDAVNENSDEDDDTVTKKLKERKDKLTKQLQIEVEEDNLKQFVPFHRQSSATSNNLISPIRQLQMLGKTASSANLMTTNSTSPNNNTTTNTNSNTSPNNTTSNMRPSPPHGSASTRNMHRPNSCSSSRLFNL